MKSDSNHIGDTVRVLRPPPRVFTDDLGKNVWMGDIPPCELELADAGQRDADQYQQDNHWIR